MYRDTRNFLNMQFGDFEREGPLDIPAINGVAVEDYIPTHFVPFSDILAKKTPADDGVHFYLDDYRFERVWKEPLRYIKPLQRYRYVCSPDFSMFTDMPVALQIYSHYRKHFCAALWESYGIQVIPTICWSDESSYAWCFDGEPEHSVVSVSSLGMRRNQEFIYKFNEGYAAMIERLHPEYVVFFGKDVLSAENYAAAPLEFHKGYSQELTDRKPEILAKSKALA